MGRKEVWMRCPVMNTLVVAGEEAEMEMKMRGLVMRHSMVHGKGFRIASQ